MAAYLKFLELALKKKRLKQRLLSRPLLVNPPQELPIKTDSPGSEIASINRYQQNLRSSLTAAQTRNAVLDAAVITLLNETLIC